MKRRIPQSGDEWFHRAVRYLARFDRTAAQVERFLTSKGASRPRSSRSFPVCLRCGTLTIGPMPPDGSRRRWHAGRWAVTASKAN